MFSGGAQQQPGFQLHAAPDEPVMHDAGDVPSSAGQPCPRAAQVTVDEAMVAESTGPVVAGTKADAGRQRGSNLSSAALVGVCVASSAATAITAGAVNPAVAFGFFVALLGGLSLSMFSVRGA